MISLKDILLDSPSSIYSPGIIGGSCAVKTPFLEPGTELEALTAKMGDRTYRYSRPRSPPTSYSVGRGVTTNAGYTSYGGELHAVPTRREVYSTPRANVLPVTTTTYKIQPDSVARASSLHDSSHSSSHRRSTLDSMSRPTLAPPQPRLRPTVHGGAGRSTSPSQSAYRSDNDGDYYAVPASSASSRSHRGHHHHRRHNSATTMDNGDMGARSVPPPRIRAGGSDREYYSSAAPRPRGGYPGTVVRHNDPITVEHSDDGYGYTNPRDLVQYDLNQAPRRRHDSFDAGSRPARPSSISSYGDLVPPKAYERERGPPMSTRGFDKINARADARAVYDVPPVRTTVPVEPVQPVPRLRPDPYESDAPRRPASRSSSRRPVSVYQEPERQRMHRDEYYDPRDDDLRDRKEKVRHAERSDRYEDDSRSYEYERERRSEKHRRDDDDRQPERKHHTGRDALATGLSLAAGALGLNAAAKAGRNDDREDRNDRSDREDNRRTRDSSKRDPSADPRRYKEKRDDRDSPPVDKNARDTQERLMPPPPRREERSRDRSNVRDDVPDRRRTPRPEAAAPEDSRNVRDARDRDSDTRRREKAEVAGETQPTSRRTSPTLDTSIEAPPPRSRAGTVNASTPTTPFNPKDPMDLRALREQLANQDAPDTREPIPRDASRVQSKEPLREAPVEKSSFEPREKSSFDPRDPRDLSNIKAELSARDENRGRGEMVAYPTNDEKPGTVRVVSPPRNAPEKTEPPKPKGILRQPREKFPEDPAPIREGVAPLKDAKKDGVPPDARWTKISRKLVNPDALEAGKERYEARDDFVIVLRVLSREEVQGYAEATQMIRGTFSAFLSSPFS